MVCTGCDEKWHQHPKRQSHNRQLLRSDPAKFVNGIVSSGDFVRTASTSITDDLSASVNSTVEKTLVPHDDMTSSADVAHVMSGDVSKVQQRDVNVLPKSVTEINDNLSCQSLFGVNDSLVSECNLTGQSASCHTPDICGSSKRRQFSSLTSEFRSTLQSLQSKMVEVSITIGNGQSSNADDWSLSPALNEQAIASRTPALSDKFSNCSHSSSMTVKELDSKQSAVQSTEKKQSVIDNDAELAEMLAQTKYPPNMGPSGLHTTQLTEQVKPVFYDEQTAAIAKSDNIDPKLSFLPDVTANTKQTTEPKDMVERLPVGNESFSTGLQNTLAVKNGSPINCELQFIGTSSGESSSSPPSGQQFTIVRQKSVTLLKQRLTDTPGVVCSRVRDGKDLGVLARSDDRTEPYRSKFSDVHDEVL